jgi:SPP1 gp7 family putative phage head morphogenesis protein
MAVTIPFDAPASVQIAEARRQRVMPPEGFYSLRAEKRALAFTVSGLARLDQVQAAADALARHIAEGGTLQEFQKWAKAQDWSLPKHRLETIYRNAVQTAYNAGHWRRFEETKTTRPFLMFDAINDSRVRPSHLALDGVIRPVDDPFWETHSPSLGHRCRCRLVSLSPEQARARGGVTQNPPAEGAADPGWGAKPTNPWRGYAHALKSKLALCETASVSMAARGRITAPLWCKDGPVRDFALMQQAWIARNGEMPPPRPLNLPETLVQPGREQEAFEEFMQAFGGGATARVTLPSGDVVVVSDDLFRTLDGRWKIGKRERDRWLRYIAAIIKAPQEIWRLELGGSQELYLLGRFLRGRQRIDALAVFKREGGGEWREGKTAYAFDLEKGIERKRRELIENAKLRWVEV